MDQNSPFISVIITCYNRKEFIKDAIESVLISTFTNFELIIVDDASTDGSSNVILNYINVDPRIKVYINEKNLGQFENRNYSASLATGKYIKYLDSDDCLYPYTLALMAEAAEKFPDAALIASSDMLHEAQPYPIYSLPVNSYRTFFITGGFPNVGPSATLIAKQAFDNVGGFPKPYYVGSDTILLLKLAAKFPIIKLPPALNWYRKHEGQALHQGIRNNEYLIKNYSAYLTILKSDYCPLILEERILAIKKLKKHYLFMFLKLITKCKLLIAGKILRQVFSS